MKTHRKIIPIVALGLALSALVPASAPASSILSGYGGPGQGTQAILGSTLLNGPSGGAGGSQGGSSALAASAAGTSASAGGGGGGGTSATARTNKGTSRSGGQAGGAAQTAAPAPLSTLAISRASTGGSGVLGLSDTAFLLILLALGALLFTGLLTRGLAKPRGTGRHARS